MRRTFLQNALAFGALVLLPALVTAHGGTYRGPGDLVPPGGRGGGGGGGTGSPAPGASGPAGPGRPAASPGSPGGAGAPGGSPSGGPATGLGAGGPDSSVWQFWWGFNQAPYLELRRRLRQEVVTGSDEFYLGQGTRQSARNRRQVTDAMLRGKVVPALLKALEGCRDSDIVTGCLIALAKIGDRSDESGRSPIARRLEEFLDHSVQEVTETAAIALGILGEETSVPHLIALMHDGEYGGVDARELVGSTKVPLRTRAFAAYGLGLIGARSASDSMRLEIVRELRHVLERPTDARPDPKVAAVIAMGLVPLPLRSETDSFVAWSEREGPSALETRLDQIAYLLDYVDARTQRANSGTRPRLALAHVPTALARLLRPFDPSGNDVDACHDPAARKAAVEGLLEILGPHSKRDVLLQQSCVAALGRIGDADADQLDALIRAALIEASEEGDAQSRRFALIAMAQVAGRSGDGEEPQAGTTELRQRLVRVMSRGWSELRPWAALSLGVLGRARLEGSEALDPATSAALAAACESERNPERIGAYCLALGLRQQLEARQTLLACLTERFVGSDDARGEAAIALGLMGDTASIDEVQRVVEESEYHFALLKQAAVGLGLLGDHDIVPTLVERLRQAKVLVTQGALASALGQIGDSRSIDPLIELMNDATASGTARSLAAAALGIIGAREDLPWNTRIAVDVNYRANAETLTNPASTGILDIL